MAGCFGRGKALKYIVGLPLYPLSNRVTSPSTVMMNWQLRGFTTASPDFSSVGFVGLGAMGYNMALNLVRKGHRVVGYDIQPGLVESFVSEGGLKAASLAELARQSTVVVSMLPALAHVKEAYQGPEGILANLKPNSFILECSTIGPVGSAELMKESARSDHHMVDCAVSGGVPGAKAGTLTFMVGARESDFEVLKSFLLKMGSKAVLCGPPSMGQAVKVANNLILGVSMLGVTEGYKLANSLGIDLKLLTEVVNASSGRCWSSDTYNPVPGIMENVPASRDYKNGYGVRLMLKDMGLALEAAKPSGTTLRTAEAALAIYKQLDDNGYGGLDFSCAYRYAV